MKHLTICIVLALVIVVLLLLICKPKWCTIRVGPEKYQVIGTYRNSQAAAQALAVVNKNIIDILRHMKTKYIESGARVDPEVIDIVQRMLRNYNYEVIKENPPGGSDTSFTVGKGKKLNICLRDAVTEDIHDPGILLFVTLHELSHIGNRTIGHDKEFWTVFKFVLLEARDSKVYNPVDYKLHPQQYCGLHVAYNPMFDTKLEDIRSMPYGTVYNHLYLNKL